MQPVYLDNEDRNYDLFRVPIWERLITGAFNACVESAIDRVDISGRIGGGH
jgi:hypothetical protein